MDREIIRVWSGPIEDLPGEYLQEKIPEGCVNVAIYSDGSRIYDKGYNISNAFREQINFRMSRCWDSLPAEEQETVRKALLKGESEV